MTKLRLLGAAVVLCSVLSGPAMAKHVISTPRHSSQKTYCQNRDPGNPYSERYDYQAWTAWRANGGWDSRRDWDCWHGSRRVKEEEVGLMELRFQPDLFEAR